MGLIELVFLLDFLGLIVGTALLFDFGGKRMPLESGRKRWWEV